MTKKLCANSILDKGYYYELANSKIGTFLKKTTKCIP